MADMARWFQKADEIPEWVAEVELLPKLRTAEAYGEDGKSIIFRCEDGTMKVDRENMGRGAVIMRFTWAEDGIWPISWFWYNESSVKDEVEMAKLGARKIDYVNLFAN